MAFKDRRGVGGSNLRTFPRNRVSYQCVRVRELEYRKADVAVQTLLEIGLFADIWNGHSEWNSSWE
jgi:hypothetical protein